MRISAKAEYACAAMLDLAGSYGATNPVRIRAISDTHKISGRFLVQILLQLKKAGLVHSVRGASGGYQLARSPEQITLASIVAAIDDRTVPSGPVLLRKANKTPIVEVLLDVWQEIEQEEQRILEKLTLAELVRRSQESNELIYQI